MKQATAVVLQATDRAIGAEIGMHRPRIAVDAKISGTAAGVIGVARAAHSGVARRLRQVELTVTGPVRSRHLTNNAAQRCIATPSPISCT